MPQKDPTPRELALAILLDVTSRKQKSHLALRDVLEKYAYLGTQRRAQTKRLTMGVLERLITLDWVLDQFSKTPTRKMKPVILNILRIALYEMLYQDGTPNRAAVSEAVKLAEKKGFGSLKGFVNGVLRSIDRALPITLPDSLEIQYSMPQWILDLWRKAYGAEKTEEILHGFAEPSPLTVHLSTAKFSSEEILSKWEEEGTIAAPIAELPDAYTLQNIDTPTTLPSFREGCFFVQDFSSMKALSALQISPDMEILDVCSAPGGKALFLAEKLGDTGHISCRDLTEAKTALIRENVERLGLANISIEAADALVAKSENKERYDLVIADLPCSGLGVLSRKPEIRYRQSLESLRSLATLQGKILDVARLAVKPGGILFYSTCTINPLENEENVAHFLERNSDFSLVTEAQLFPKAGEWDGFYFSVLKKKV